VKYHNVDLGKWHRDEANPGHAWPTDRLSICGHDVHVYALEVTICPDTGVQRAVEDDCVLDVEAVQHLHYGSVATTHLLGLAGEWVIVAHPHGS